MKRRDMVVMGVATATTGMAAKALAQLPRAEPLPASTAAPATSAGAASMADRHFTAAQLDQMLAPIALYPDALMAQILMAATYPLEVVEAARWSKDNPALKGDAAADGRGTAADRRRTTRYAAGHRHPADQSRRDLYPELRPFDRLRPLAPCGVSADLLPAIPGLGLRRRLGRGRRTGVRRRHGRRRRLLRRMGLGLARLGCLGRPP